jgi:hypothetical protein
MISSETSRVRYAGDGVTTDFVAPWHQVDLSLKVVKRAVTGVETELPFGSGYTYVSTSDTGATIRCGVAPAVGEVLAILRNDPATQTTDLVDNEAFPAAAIENSIDRAIAVGAMLKERWTRALALKDTDGLAGGEYPAGGNRISGLADPINDTDAATKGWVSILLAQYAAGAGAVITPGSATSPNWNANALYGRAVANVAPTDGYVLTWSFTNNRWEPKASSSVTGLLGTPNEWTATNIFDAAVTFKDTATLSTAGKALVFGSTSQRIKGRFYGTPYSNRTIFTPDVANQNCQIACLPTLAGGEGAWDIFGSTDPDNAQVLHLACNSTNTTLQATHTGGGVTQQFTFYMDATLSYRIGTNGRMQMNGAADNGAQLNVNGSVSRQAGTFRAHRNGTPLSVASGAFTKVTMTTEDYDQAGWFDLANSKYVPQIAGKYAINFGVGMDAAAVTSGKRLAGVLYKNGAAHRLGNNSHASAADALTSIGMATVDSNGSTDYFELYVFQNMGAPQNLNGAATDNFIEGFHIG